MDKIRKAVSGPVGAVLFCVLQAAIGVMLLIEPVRFTSGVVITAGAALALWGVVCVIRYFAAKPEDAAGSRLLFRGLVAVMAGAVCMTQYSLMLTAFPLLAVIYAGWMLVLAALKLQQMTDLLRLHTGRWYMPGIAALLAVALAAVIFINPFGAAEAVWIFAGIALIAEAVVDLTCVFLK